jgi:predicted DNA-binding protein
MASDNDHALTLRLPEDLHEELKKRAEQEDRTIASVLRQAAKAYLGHPAHA